MNFTHLIYIYIYIYIYLQNEGTNETQAASSQQRKILVGRHHIQIS
jgi:hypothetical protein